MRGEDRDKREPHVNLERSLASLHRLDEEGWARHANPWSGWSRMLTGMPLIVLALWSRAWLGWWSLVPIALVMAWLLLNPRLFPPARDDASWVSRGVLGERLWVGREERPVPARHRRVPPVLNALSGLSALVLVYGLVVLEPWPTVFGAVLSTVFKLWFIDRMVLLYEDMARDDPALRYEPPR